MRKLIVTEKGQALIEEVSTTDPTCFELSPVRVALAEALWRVKTTPFRSARYFNDERPTRRAVVNRLISDGYLECVDISDKIIRFTESLSIDEGKPYSTDAYVPPECEFSKRATELLDRAINEPEKVAKEEEQLMLTLFAYADTETRARVLPVAIFQLVKQGWLIPAEVEEGDDILALEDLL